MAVSSSVSRSSLVPSVSSEWQAQSSALLSSRLTDGLSNGRLSHAYRYNTPSHLLASSKASEEPMASLRGESELSISNTPEHELEARALVRRNVFGTLQTSWLVKNCFASWRSCIHLHLVANAQWHQHDVELRAVLEMSAAEVRRDLQHPEVLIEDMEHRIQQLLRDEVYARRLAVCRAVEVSQRLGQVSAQDRLLLRWAFSLILAWTCRCLDERRIIELESACESRLKEQDARHREVLSEAMRVSETSMASFRRDLETSVRQREARLKMAIYSRGEAAVDALRSGHRHALFAGVMGAWRCAVQEGRFVSWRAEHESTTTLRMQRECDLLKTELGGRLLHERTRLGEEWEERLLEERNRLLQESFQLGEAWEQRLLAECAVLRREAEWELQQERLCLETAFRVERTAVDETWEQRFRDQLASADDEAAAELKHSEAEWFAAIRCCEAETEESVAAFLRVEADWRAEASLELQRAQAEWANDLERSDAEWSARLRQAAAELKHSEAEWIAALRRCEVEREERVEEFLRVEADWRAEASLELQHAQAEWAAVLERSDAEWSARLRQALHDQEAAEEQLRIEHEEQLHAERHRLEKCHGDDNADRLRCLMRQEQIARGSDKILRYSQALQVCNAAFVRWAALRDRRNAHARIGGSSYALMHRCERLLLLGSLFARWQRASLEGRFASRADEVSNQRLDLVVGFAKSKSDEELMLQFLRFVLSSWYLHHDSSRQKQGYEATLQHMDSLRRCREQFREAFGETCSATQHAMLMQRVYMSWKSLIQLERCGDRRSRASRDKLCAFASKALALQRGPTLGFFIWRTNVVFSRLRRTLDSLGQEVGLLRLRATHGRDQILYLLLDKYARSLLGYIMSCWHEDARLEIWGRDDACREVQIRQLRRAGTNARIAIATKVWTTNVSFLLFATLRQWRQVGSDARSSQNMARMRVLVTALKHRAVERKGSDSWSLLRRILALWRHLALDCRGQRERANLLEWGRALQKERDEESACREVLALQDFITRWRLFTVNMHHLRALEVLRGSARSGGFSRIEMQIVAAADHRFKVVMWEILARWSLCIRLRVKPLAVRTLTTEPVAGCVRPATSSAVTATVISKQYIPLRQPVQYVQMVRMYDEFCACGNVYMPDALFCRKCGRPRGDHLVQRVVEAQLAKLQRDHLEAWRATVIRERQQPGMAQQLMPAPYCCPLPMSPGWKTSENLPIGAHLAQPPALMSPQGVAGVRSSSMPPVVFHQGREAMAIPVGGGLCVGGGGPLVYPRSSPIVSYVNASDHMASLDSGCAMWSPKPLFVLGSDEAAACHSQMPPPVTTESVGSTFQRYERNEVSCDVAPAVGLERRFTMGRVELIRREAGQGYHSSSCSGTPAAGMAPMVREALARSFASTRRDPQRSFKSACESVVAGSPRSPIGPNSPGQQTRREPRL